MLQNLEPIIKNLVLIGGGHSHAIILKKFSIKPLSGVRLTLISACSDTPYSGMLPGHIAGFYSREECHIDLQNLANLAQAEFYIDRVIGIDLINKKVLCAKGSTVPFDVLSVNIGSTPATISVSGAAEYAISAKPVNKLLEHWYDLIECVSKNAEKSISIGIVGGGAGGVELALSMNAYLHKITQANFKKRVLEIYLFQREAELMLNYPQSMRRQVEQILRMRGIKLHLSESVSQIEPKNLTDNLSREKIFNVICESGLKIECNQIFWVTQASAPEWLKTSGLATDEQNFILVNDKLQSLTHPFVFAAGDIATMVNHPRPKAGVFAVRQGKPLFDNLRQYLLEKPLKTYQPQQDYLSLIGTGDGKAIATRGTFTSPPLQLFWKWKDAIDRRFMKQFNQ